MLLRRSESVLRLLIGLALGFGFLGFATQSRAEDNPNTWIRPQAASQLERMRAPDWVPEGVLQAAARAGFPARAGKKTGTAFGAAPPMVWRDGQGFVSVLRPGLHMSRDRKGVLLSVGGSF